MMYRADTLESFKKYVFDLGSPLFGGHVLIVSSEWNDNTIISKALLWCFNKMMYF